MAKKNIWYEIKFLESTQNLRTILSANSGKGIKHRLSNDITSCLQQGRSFFEIAELSPIEIKPLIVYYGMVGFAEAIIMARTLSNIETLPRTHGLQDVSDNSATLDSLTLKIGSRGTFHSMNDSVRKLEKFIVHEDRDIRKIKQPTTESLALNNKAFTLKDILARIHDIEDHYKDTFKEDAKIIKCSHFSKELISDYACYKFEIHVDALIRSSQDVIKIVGDLRSKCSFLKNWSFEGAMCVGDLCSLRFISNKYPRGNSEDNSDISLENLVENDWGYGTYCGPPSISQDDIWSKTTPISGNLSSGIKETYIIEPFEGLFLSEVTLLYMGMFLLSSLVRYRPNMWSNALSRRVGSNNHIDDKALSLIEHFIEVSLLEYPEFVVNIIKEPFD